MVSSSSTVPVRITLSYVIISHSIILQSMIAPETQVLLKLKLKLLEENTKTTTAQHLNTSSYRHQQMWRISRSCY
jgi:hypothetical protein